MGFCIIKTTIPNSCNQKNQTLKLPIMVTAKCFQFICMYSEVYYNGKQNKNSDL